MYRVYCEWDIGLGDTVFATYSLAERHATKALKDVDIEEEFDELEQQGLVGIEYLNYIDGEE